jgi:hypothetical protein
MAFLYSLSNPVQSTKCHCAPAAPIAASQFLIVSTHSSPTRLFAVFLAGTYGFCHWMVPQENVRHSPSLKPIRLNAGRAISPIASVPSAVANHSRSIQRQAISAQRIDRRYDLKKQSDSPNVTTLNRLYPAPPLQQAEQLDKSETLTTVSTTMSLPNEHSLPLPTWSRQQWRQFDAAFIRLETILNSARNPLLDAATPETKVIRFTDSLHCTSGNASCGACGDVRLVHELVWLRPAGVNFSFLSPSGIWSHCWLAYLPNRLLHSPQSVAPSN